MAKARKCHKCQRPATRLVAFLNKWRPICRYHIASFSDLPMRKLDMGWDY